MKRWIVVIVGIVGLVWAQRPEGNGTLRESNWCYHAQITGVYTIDNMEGCVIYEITVYKDHCTSNPKDDIYVGTFLVLTDECSIKGRSVPELPLDGVFVKPQTTYESKD